MGIRVVDLVPGGNVVASAWSEDDLVALVMQSGYAGAMRGFVLDATDAYRVISSFSLPSFPHLERRLLLTFPKDRRGVLVTSDGRTATWWTARSGSEIASHPLVAEREHGRAIAVLRDGRLVTRVTITSSETVKNELRVVDDAGRRVTLHPSLGAADLALPFGELPANEKGADFLTWSYGGWQKGGVLARANADGAIRWEVPMTENLLLFALPPSRVMTLRHGRDRLTVRDAETGSVQGEITTEGGTQIADFGSVGHDGIWVMLGKGEVRFFAADLRPTRSLALDRLAMQMTVSPDGTRGLVHVDRMELESEAHIVDLRDGATLLKTKRTFGPKVAARGHTELWIGGAGGLVRIGEADGSLASVHAHPTVALAVAGHGDAVVFASNHKVFVVDRAGKTKPRAIDKYFGEPMLAVSADGTLVLLHEEKGLHLIDVAKGKRIFSHRAEAVEHAIIDAVDDVLFDREGVPCVRHGAHTTRLTAEAIDGTGVLAPAPASWRLEVRLDDSVALVDGKGAFRLALHLAPNGKAGIVENGERLDWLGVPAQAKQVRGVFSGDALLHGKALDAVREDGLVVTTCARLRLKG